MPAFQPVFGRSASLKVSNLLNAPMSMTIKLLSDFSRTIIFGPLQTLDVDRDLIFMGREIFEDYLSRKIIYYNPHEMLGEDELPTAPYAKAGVLQPTDFSGDPKVAQITFALSFPNTNFVVIVQGYEQRSFTVESLTVDGAIVNTNANTALTLPVFWFAYTIGESPPP